MHQDCAVLVDLLSIASITNYYQFRGLKQHPFIISQFCRSEVQVGACELSAASLTRPTSKGQPSGLFSGDSGRNLPGSFRLLAEYSSLWLQDGGPCFLAGHQPGATLSASGGCPPSFSSHGPYTSSHQLLCMLESCWFPFLPLLSAFKGSYAGITSTWIIQNY